MNRVFFPFNDIIILELCVCPHHNKIFVVIPVQVSPCWLLPCLCRQEWVYSRKCCIKNMENTPRRPSSTMCVFFSSCNILEAATVVLTAWDSNISLLCRFTALSASARLPAPLHRHLQSLRLLQPEQWVPQVEIMLCLKRFFFIYMKIFCLSAPVNVPVLSISVPIMWLYMLGNIITQYPVSKFILQANSLLMLNR